MLRGTLRTARYARGWKAGCDVETAVVEIDRAGVSIPATLYSPRVARTRVPGWIAVGGVSRRGRSHPQLVRFASSLAASGAAVLVPEIPEWQDLRVSPSVIRPTLRGSVDYMRTRPEVLPDQFGGIGFSFGAPGLAMAASHEELGEDFAGLVLFGGYYCLERTLGCMLTGRHEWDGVDYSLNPDPYGRWVVASNHLTAIDGHEDAGDVAAALFTLAAAASDRRIPAWESHHDEMIADLRHTISASRRDLFDCFATPSTKDPPSPDRCADIATRLAAACRRVDPLLEPADALSTVTVPTQVIHGRGDRLVPFTEGLRLMDGFQDHVQRGATVTRLFNHKSEDRLDSLRERTSEGLKLFGALREMINTV